MKTLSASIIAFYLCNVSSAYSAEDAYHGEIHDTIKAAKDDHYIHGEVAHKIEEGIHNAEHASKGGLPQLDPTWFASQVFWLAIFFAILYFVFSKKTLPEISSVIENRKNHIQSNLEAAEKLTAEADQVHDEYHANLEKAQASAAEAVQKVDNEIKQKAADAFDDYRERSETEINAVEARILDAKAGAMNDMNAMAAEVASVAIEKIINEKANPSQVQSLIEGLSKKSAKKAKAA